MRKRIYALLLAVFLAAGAGVLPLQASAAPLPSGTVHTGTRTTNAGSRTAHTGLRTAHTERTMRMILTGEESTQDQFDFSWIDLDPSHYDSDAQFANELLHEASLLGRTKMAEALLQAAYEASPNPRFLTAETALLQSQWRLSVEYKLDADTDEILEYTEHEYDDAGDEVISRRYEASKNWEPAYQVYPDGTPVPEYVLTELVSMEYDSGHLLLLRSGVKGWQDSGLITPEEMEKRLEEGLTDHQDRYVYNKTGTPAEQYYRQADQEFLVRTWEYDESGRLLLQENQFWAGEKGVHTENEYDEDGSLAYTTYFDADDHEISYEVFFYDSYGLLAEKEHYTGEILLSQTEYTYDDNGVLQESVWTALTPDGEEAAYRLCTYDESGNLLNQLSEDDRTQEMNESAFEYEYDDEGLLTRKQEFSYDADGNEQPADPYSVYEYVFFELPERQDPLPEDASSEGAETEDEASGAEKENDAPGTQEVENASGTKDAENTSGIQVTEDGEYTDKDHVALYIHTYGHLPSNYITKKEANALGWPDEGYLKTVAPGKSIGGDTFGNYEGILPKKKGRKYYECDIDFGGKSRNAKRIVFSNDGLIFYTEDHYESFEQLYGGE